MEDITYEQALCFLCLSNTHSRGLIMWPFKRMSYYGCKSNHHRLLHVSSDWQSHSMEALSSIRRTQIVEVKGNVVHNDTSSRTFLFKKQTFSQFMTPAWLGWTRLKLQWMLICQVPGWKIQTSSAMKRPILPDNYTKVLKRLENTEIKPSKNPEMAQDYQAIITS